MPGAASGGKPTEGEQATVEIREVVIGWGCRSLRGWLKKAYGDWTNSDRDSSGGGGLRCAVVPWAAARNKAYGG